MSLPAASDFAQIVATEIKVVRDFVALLTEEAEVLQANDAASLERITATKEKLADELESLGRKRGDFFTAIGLAQNAAAVDSWLATQPANFAKLWRELMRLAETAKELNLANGQCIALLARDTQARLAAITGQPGGNEGIYTAQGRAASPFSSPSSTDTGFRISDDV